MQHIIAQKDEMCSLCTATIPDGSEFVLDLYDEAICLDCLNEDLKQEDYEYDEEIENSY